MSRFRSMLFIFLISIASVVRESICSPARSASTTVDPSKVKQISWKPRAFVYEGFLTDLECDHLISIARSELKRSEVADNESGKSKLSTVRTSSGMFIPKSKDAIVSGIEDKIAAWTFLPKENGEDIQVLRYEHGQRYESHYDYFVDKVNIAWGGHRLATVLMYLSDVTKGGETVFPMAEKSPHRRASETDEDLSDCARKGIAVKPKKGDALLFFSLEPNAIPDTKSLHGGCPVLEGEKWSATKWIHVDSFSKNLANVGNCTDLNESCERWAALGECTKNPEYMGREREREREREEIGEVGDTNNQQQHRNPEKTESWVGLLV
ncbi:probable prolyl 4-hydroxylase 4 isoform X2 [Cucurbita moschata]|uniref:procollagen-proline 4-dioxygenase n=1 Tax=Cucurbita moschata TaxID=3662 RepID=A0A6J1ER58_CUCMO|nr:probable prolyl 4-hydroxylase 4 isoform X2 [Cucurbita moschata]